MSAPWLPSHPRAVPALLVTLLEMLHGADLVDVVWYPNTRRAAARLQDGAITVYDDTGVRLGDGPVLGERGWQILPGRRSS